MTYYFLALLAGILILVNLVFLKNKSIGLKVSYSLFIVAAFMVAYVGLVVFLFNKSKTPGVRYPDEMAHTCSESLTSLIRHSNIKSSFKELLSPEIEERNQEQIKVSLNVVDHTQKNIIGWVIIDLKNRMLLDITADDHDPIVLNYKTDDWDAFLICIGIEIEEVAENLVSSNLTKASYDTGKTGDVDPFKKDTLTHASRNGIIRLPVAGATAIFQDNKGEPHDEDIKTFKYLGTYPTLKKYLLEVHVSEDHYYLLVDQKTGLQDTIQGMPYFSPDRTKIFASQDEYEDGDEDMHLVSANYIYKRVSNRTKVAASDSYKWLVRECYWKDNKTVYVKASTSQDPLDFFYKMITIGVPEKKVTNHTKTSLAAWIGSYKTSLYKGSDDSRDEQDIEINIYADSIIYMESGYQLYNKYSLSAKEENKVISLTYKSTIEGGSPIVDSQHDFGTVKKNGDAITWESPYLDEREGVKKQQRKMLKTSF